MKFNFMVLTIKNQIKFHKNKKINKYMKKLSKTFKSQKYLNLIKYIVKKKNIKKMQLN